ncbi:hypothetical protein AK812_SmicGene34596 [Symbiodinium microadriaticum]|uniref:Uncharacterized protein n=1 Tax=Symbiodinium microadriaticum TaxID=2951 RepID=A0A1Q9CNL4_SYMMI|nr:hypothetical protein AK812_SmicGene34596 [Symbiodinium microadriaticum]
MLAVTAGQTRSSCPTREPQLPAMGCAPSTVQDDFEHVATSAVITKTEQVSATAEVSERLEDAISTEAGDEEDNDIQVRIEVVIPEHLKTILFGHVVDGPAAFEEGTSSWSVHAAWNRARPIPKHIVLKPDRSMHDKHVQRIDRFRLAVECNPDRFADMVDTRRASVSQQTARHDSKFDREVQQVEEEIDDVDLCRNLAVLLLLLVTFWMIKIQDDQRNVRHQDS